MIVGGMGNDALAGGIGADSLDGGGDDDYLTIDDADISVVGGAGFDRVVLGGTTAGAVTLDLNAGQIEYVLATTSTFNNIFDATGASWDVLIYGGSGDDTIFGGDGNDKLSGRAGNDTIVGNGGDDKIYGDQGNDTVSYVTAGAAVDVNLSTRRASGGAGNDILTSIENVLGSSFIDEITGDANDNILDGSVERAISSEAVGSTLF
ncbi:MAG: calcium-binding protein [Planctomycetaceae bacterium]